MRRPLKPFVTEYRGGARRQAGAQGQGAKADSTKLEPERSEPRPAGPWPAQTRPSISPQEDGYEAALRAADALFAARQRDPEAAPGVAQPAGEPESAQAPALPSASGGRILRAMDEPPSPELLRLEAEFAPKRRGRKPGSKNKPKLPAPVVEAAVAVAAEPVAAEPVAIEQAPLRATNRAVVFPALSIPLQAKSALAAGPRDERYAWVRTKLKPGQRWKRRLPKVAW